VRELRRWLLYNEELFNNGKLVNAGGSWFPVVLGLYQIEVVWAEIIRYV
jgi:hypothetical protein